MMGNNKGERLIKDIKNSFTYEFWAKPESIHQLEKQSQEQPIKFSSGKNYIIGPAHGENEDEAGVSVSVGLNGISVYEHTIKDIYAALVYETRINELIHIAVVYDNRMPSLFINGQLVKKGERSTKKYVYPSGIIAGHPGLFFNGNLKEIRIWDYSRTEKQLKSFMNIRLNGEKEGLFFTWPAMDDDETKIIRAKSSTRRKENSRTQYQNNSKDQTIEVSIIIPSYNRYPLNLFTLYSLENQTFDLSKMEVIFIDDASTDQTEIKLKDYHPPFHFNYIRNQQNLGRAKVRNLGIKSSRGKVLIFLDAEMITEPDFVKNHYQYHQSKKNVVLSGAMFSKYVISCVFPEFDRKQLERISSLTKNNQDFNTRFQNYKQSSSSFFPLIEKADIMNQTYRDLIFKTIPWFSTITRNFGENLEGFQFPWMAFLTGNVSLRKELIEQAGLFDEDFVKYGYEDWELGYRLYKLGAQYINNNEVMTYHQEHPVGESKWKEAIKNFNLFISKHRDVDVLILGLELALFEDLLSMNKIFYEYKLLTKKYPDKFQAFQEKFIAILETIVLMLQIDIRHFNVLGAAGFGANEKKELLTDIESIRSLNRFTNLTDFMDKIIRL